MKRVVWVTGGGGLVGSALRELVTNGTVEDEWLFTSSKEVDLLDYHQVESYVRRHRVDTVIHLAARVGGLYYNTQHNPDMFIDNTIMNINVARACHRCRVRKVISCLSTCVFPDRRRELGVLREEDLHEGPPHPSNSGYAYAKRGLDVIGKAYNAMPGNGTRFVTIIPTNVYGPHDTFDLARAHVIPGLINKCFTAKQTGGELWVWGKGEARRQFVYAPDLARVLLWAVDNLHEERLIVAPDEEYTIADVVHRITEAFDFTGHVRFDGDYSEGQLQKTASNALVKRLCPWLEFTPLSMGLRETIDWYKLRQST